MLACEDVARAYFIAIVANATVIIPTKPIYAAHLCMPFTLFTSDFPAEKFNIFNTCTIYKAMKLLQKNEVFIYYLLTIVVMSIITVRTYAFYNAPLSMISITVLSLTFVFIAVTRIVLQPRLIDTQPVLDQPKLQLSFDLALFIAAACILFLIEVTVNQQSYLIAGKFFSAIIFIGYFASMDSALNRERLCYAQSINTSQPISSTTPVSRRFSLFLTLTLLVVILANTLSAYSYMSLNLTQPTISLDELKSAYLIETFFTLGIVVSLTLRLIHSYSINLQHLFDVQVDALKHIENGKFDNYVPVVSRDEFGIIAQQTNRVIDELREKDKIQKTLQRIVSPDVMRKLMQADSDTLQHGENKNVAIFFCDLRQYTAYAERTPPEDVIFFLNAYFTKIVDIVSEHNGIVNKFMGDAILAVFPLENGIAEVEDAVNTAWDVILHSQAINLPGGDKFKVGIGIHVGPATAGTIGSHDRFEYTFIGDTVNTASRLDGLSKRLGYSIIISADTYKKLNRDAQDRFTNLGMQKVRGKKAPLHVYGAAPTDW